MIFECTGLLQGAVVTGNQYTYQGTEELLEQMVAEHGAAVAVPVAVEQHAHRPLPVSPRPAGLLVVTLDRLGQTLVDHKTH